MWKTKDYATPLNLLSLPQQWFIFLSFRLSCVWAIIMVEHSYFSICDEHTISLLCCVFSWENKPRYFSSCLIVCMQLEKLILLFLFQMLFNVSKVYFRFEITCFVWLMLCVSGIYMVFVCMCIWWVNGTKH